MSTYFYLSNVRILLWLNHALAGHPALYKCALFLTDHGADLLTGATLLLLWFWPDKTKKQPMFYPVTMLVPNAGQNGSDGNVSNGNVSDGSDGSVAVLTRTATTRKLLIFKRTEFGLTRAESRAQLLVLLMAGIAAYVAARLIAMQVDVSRPFATYLPVVGMEGAFEGLRTYGSFPSDHGALLGALPLALFHWHRRLAWAWVAAAAFLIVVRVAVGFHYPSDMLAGAAIGVIFTALAFNSYHKNPRRRASVNALAQWFETSNWPYCYLLYALLALVGLEFAMHFQHVLQLLFSARGEFMQRFGA